MATPHRNVETVNQRGEHRVDIVTLTDDMGDEGFYFVDLFAPALDGELTCTTILSTFDRRKAAEVANRLSVFIDRLHDGQSAM